MMQQSAGRVVSSEGERSRHVSSIRRITWIGLAVNLGLTVLKFIVGYVGMSQAVIADAVHSLSDMATDFAVIIGVKYWSKPPDVDHPYGHSRIEAFITAMIGLALAAAGIGVGYHALATVRDPHIVQPAWIAISGPACSIVLKEILYHWTVMVGKRTNSHAVIANAWHHRSDALSSLPALIAVGASMLNPDWAFVDHVGALIVSVFILKVSWDIIKPASVELTDRGANERERKTILSVAAAVSGVKEVHAVRTRRFGSAMSVDLHILVDPGISVREGHNISEDVKKTLLESGPRVVDVVVHLEPYEKPEG